MRIETLKPLHGWRQFVGEVGIIVLGVLLALGAENLLEDLRWQQQVSATEVRLKDELGAVAGVSYERLILQPCISARLSELGAALRTSTGKWKGSPMKVNGATPRALAPAYLLPNRPLYTDAWDNAETSGTLNHMPDDRVLRTGVTYSQARQFFELQEEEARTAARIMPLAYDADLALDTRINMLAAVGDLDRINTLMALTGRQILEEVRSLQLGFDPRKVEAGRRELVSERRSAFGTCVEDKPLRL